MGLYRAQGYGDEEMKMEYIKSTSRDIELFVNIESKEAVENIDEIFASDISGYFLGPYDLSASIGSPGKFETIEFIDMEKKILKAAKKHNVSKGIHVVEPNIESFNQKVSDGYELIAFSVDFRCSKLLLENRLKMTRTLAVIPARLASSSRFPNKPLKMILGIPMIAHCLL